MHTRQIIKSNFRLKLFEQTRAHTHTCALHKIICSTRKFIVKFFCFRACMQKRKRIYLLNPTVIKQQRIHLRVSYSYCWCQAELFFSVSNRRDRERDELNEKLKFKCFIFVVRECCWIGALAHLTLPHYRASVDVFQV